MGSTTMLPGVMASADAVDGIVWDVLGQTYRPKQVSTSSFAFDTLFPPGTFVPPHYHPDQDEFIRVAEGTFSLWLDGQETVATAGDIVCLPKGCKHGIFNKSDADVRALFWVAPSLTLFDLFTKLNGLGDPAEVVRVSAEHNIFFLPPPGA